MQETECLRMGVTNSERD